MGMHAAPGAPGARGDPGRASGADPGRAWARPDPIAAFDGALVDVLARRLGGRERVRALALELGIVDERDLAIELAGRSGLPFVGLRGRSIDPRLLRYVPFSFCRAHRLVPVRLDDDGLAVACTVPLDAVRHLERRLPGVRVLPMIALSTEIDELLARSLHLVVES